MSTKGLTKEKIIAEAIAYIEESGQSRISLHELARRLGIKTPSLYNHIKNTRDLRHEIFRHAITMFVDNQNAATEGKQKDEAVMAFADAYFSFARENKGLYRLIMSMPQDNDDTEKELAVPLLETAIRLLRDYGKPSACCSVLSDGASRGNKCLKEAQKCKRKTNYSQPCPSAGQSRSWRCQQ